MQTIERGENSSQIYTHIVFGLKVKTNTLSYVLSKKGLRTIDKLGIDHVLDKFERFWGKSINA